MATTYGTLSISQLNVYNSVDPNIPGELTFDNIDNNLVMSTGLNLNGNLSINGDDTRYIEFGDGSKQYVAYTGQSGGGDVFLAGNNTFTGKNTFESTFNVNNALTNIGQLDDISNTAIGNGAFNNYSSTGSNNTAFGNNALRQLTTGTNNVAIGLNANYFVESGSNNIAIGPNTGVYGTDPATLSNTISIGNGITSVETGNMIFGFSGFPNSIDQGVDYWAKFTPNRTNDGITLEGIYNGSRNFTIAAPGSDIYLDAANINLNGDLKINNHNLIFSNTSITENGTISYSNAGGGGTNLTNFVFNLPTIGPGVSSEGGLLVNNYFTGNINFQDYNFNDSYISWTIASNTRCLLNLSIYNIANGKSYSFTASLYYIQSGSTNYNNIANSGQESMDTVPISLATNDNNSNIPPGQFRLASALGSYTYNIQLYFIGAYFTVDPSWS